MMIHEEMRGKELRGYRVSYAFEVRQLTLTPTLIITLDPPPLARSLPFLIAVKAVLRGSTLTPRSRSLLAFSVLRSAFVRCFMLLLWYRLSASATSYSSSWSWSSTTPKVLLTCGRAWDYGFGFGLGLGLGLGSRVGVG